MIVVAIAIAAYAAAMVGANLLVLEFGPSITAVNAFWLIGLDLALRDYLHMRLRPAHMGLLIGATGLLTWALNPAAQQIAIASSIAFVAAGVVDWLVFRAATGPWLRRSVLSNIAGAAVDSLIFPTLAFGALMPGVVALQFIAKAVGGAAWATVLQPTRREARA